MSLISRDGGRPFSDENITPSKTQKKVNETENKEGSKLASLERSGSNIYIGENQAGTRKRSSTTPSKEAELLKLAEGTRRSTKERLPKDITVKAEPLTSHNIMKLNVRNPDKAFEEVFNRLERKLEDSEVKDIEINLGYFEKKKLDHGQRNKAFGEVLKRQGDLPESTVERMDMLVRKWNSQRESEKREHFDQMRQMSPADRKREIKEYTEKGKEKLPDQVDSGKGKEKEKIGDQGYVKEKEKEKGVDDIRSELLAVARSKHADTVKDMTSMLDTRDGANFAKSLMEGSGVFKSSFSEEASDKREVASLKTTMKAMDILQDAKVHPENYSKSEIKEAKANAFTKEQAKGIVEALDNLISKASPLEIMQMRIFIQKIRSSPEFSEIADKKLADQFQRIDLRLSLEEHKAAIELEPYMHKINVFLEIKLGEFAAFLPELIEQIKKEQEELVQFIEPVKQICEQKHEMLISRILSTNVESKEYKELVKEFATEVNENSLVAFGALNINAEQPIKENLPKLQDLSPRALGLTRFATYTALSVENPKDRAKVYNFFLDIAGQLANTKHDYYSGTALWGTINDPDVTRTIPMNLEENKKYTDLRKLYEGKGEFLLDEAGKRIIKREHTNTYDEDGNEIIKETPATTAKPIDQAHQDYEDMPTFLPNHTILIGNLDHLKEVTRDNEEIIREMMLSPEEMKEHILEDRKKILANQEKIMGSALTAQNRLKGDSRGFHPIIQKNTGLVAFETYRTEDELHAQSDALLDKMQRKK